MGKPWESPLAVFLTRQERTSLARFDEASPLVRRAFALLFACVQRGRGRIPNAFRAEAAILDRAARLVALLQRERADPRQVAFAFLETMPLAWRWRWGALFCGGSTDARRARRRRFLYACVSIVLWRAGRAERLKAAQERRRAAQYEMLRPVERLLRAGAKGEALAELRRLARAGCDVSLALRIRTLVLAGDRSRALREIRALHVDSIFGPPLPHGYNFDAM
jgi:hypothetical protein